MLPSLRGANCCQRNWLLQPHEVPRWREGLRFITKLCDDSVMAKRPTVVGIGEILWDVFPDGPHFGGVPANFACSVAELCSGEMDVFMVGSVGRDDLGRQAIELLKSHGVDTSCVSIAGFPTGQVLVSLDETGQPSFEIAPETAWDNVVWSNELEKLAAQADAVCFGTLAQRSSICAKRFASSCKQRDLSACKFWTSICGRRSGTITSCETRSSWPMYLSSMIRKWKCCPTAETRSECMMNYWNHF